MRIVRQGLELIEKKGTDQVDDPMRIAFRIALRIMDDAEDTRQVEVGCLYHIMWEGVPMLSIWATTPERALEDAKAMIGDDAVIQRCPGMDGNPCPHHQMYEI